MTIYNSPNLIVDHSNIRKILIIQLGGIGDVVLTTPIFGVLRNKFPQAQIHFLTSSLVSKLFRRDPYLDEVLVYPTPSTALYRVFRYFTKSRTNQYDLVIDYQCTPGTAQLSWFSGARYRLGWKMKRRQWAYNLFSEANNSADYVALQKIKALKELGIIEKPGKLQIFLDQDDVKEVKKYFLTENINPQQLKINMTPVGQVQTRQWEIDHYVTLAERLIEKYHATVFFSGKNEDQGKLHSLASQAKYEIKVLPVWPLHQFTAFLSQVDLHFSYDNGPKHLAIAVNTPTLSLFATDMPSLWNPMDDPNHPFLLAEVPCRYCRLTECRLMVCMKSIPPEKVIDQMERIPALRSKIML